MSELLRVQLRAALDITPEKVATLAAKPATAKKQKWPTGLPERMQLLKAARQQQPVPVSAAEVADQFTGRGKAQRAETIEELLDTLVAIGQARQTDDGRYAA